ncbi:hypothetical protein N7516_000621 [Penicillium verrucosum]|uniref:uncharacterized protein n=1 Tax=Penicillium verrucosum TaxID=60171 RepID=UPI002544D2FA|nr:uncharacterized protein N7516_000621 [Penicillium verrucosum]KAJ5940453.1 hypothetical protein N7516_000621 [Penicillium verrucosum]
MDIENGTVSIGTSKQNNKISTGITGWLKNAALCQPHWIDDRFVDLRSPKEAKARPYRNMDI